MPLPSGAARTVPQPRPAIKVTFVCAILLWDRGPPGPFFVCVKTGRAGRPAVPQGYLTVAAEPATVIFSIAFQSQAMPRPGALPG